MATGEMIVPQAHGFSQEQIDIIKSQVAPRGTTNDELAMFLMYCQRTGLDPFARQIYLSERRSQVNGQWVVSRKPETTIDGFRLIAERGQKYAGQLGPFWCGEDGQWRDVWTAREAPIAARVGVLRHDFKEPLYAVALYDEYVQTKSDGKPNSMWSKMPANQLAKCAESLALRRAFPRELSGLYTREEMAQAEIDTSGIDTGPHPVGTQEAANYVRDKQLAAPKPEKSEVFKMRDAFAGVKSDLKKLTGSDDKYYSILGEHGYEKSTQITDRTKGASVYGDLRAAYKEAIAAQTSDKDNITLEDEPNV